MKYRQFLHSLQNLNLKYVSNHQPIGEAYRMSIRNTFG
jgi:hypothetical protein